MNSVIRALEIDEGGIAAFVGAGGKTTLMLKIAAELSLVDRDILVTTTTQIMAPGGDLAAHLFLAGSRRELIDRAGPALRRYRCLVAASTRCSDTGKLTGFEPGFIDEIWRSGRFRWILTEADGSAQKPVKAPDAHEPVVPRDARYLFGLVGLSALGKPLGDTYVHRPGCLQRITGLAAGDMIDATAIAALIQHPNGLFKDQPPPRRVKGGR